MASVVHHQRRPEDGHHSIERLFDGIRAEFNPVWQVEVSSCPHFSKGIMPRLKNLKSISGAQADIHHIVGDVHYLALGLPSEKIVLTIHDCAVLERLKGWRREVVRQLWFVQPIRRASMVTTISQTTKEELRRWVGELANKVVVIPNCVRSEFQPCSKTFDNRCPVVLQVGTGWNKNLVGVARALIGISCRLDIIGTLDASQRASVEATGVTFRELGRLTDEQVLEAYHSCDLVVFASFYEGFGLPILEAQAIGRPVVTSNLSSMPEAAGKEALLVDPTDPRTIHQAVVRIIEDVDLRTSLIQAGFENIARFRPAYVAKLYEAVYRQCLSGRE